MEIKQRKNSKIITTREQQLIELIAGGFNDGETSEKMGISPQVIRLNVSAILKKTNTNNRPQLVYWAFKNGILE